VTPCQHTDESQNGYRIRRLTPDWLFGEGGAISDNMELYQI
jgi:hypothetical protein